MSLNRIHADSWGGAAHQARSLLNLTAWFRLDEFVLRRDKMLAALDFAPQSPLILLHIKQPPASGFNQSATYL
jgi:hypothetical protein